MAKAAEGLATKLGWPACVPFARDSSLLGGQAVHLSSLFGHPSKVCCTVSPVLSCLWASRGFRPYIKVLLRVGSHSLPFEQGRLSGPASRAISVDTTFAALELLTLSFNTFLTALTLLPAGLSIPTCFRMAEALCVWSCGTQTKTLPAIASPSFCKWPRRGHRSVLVSQTG